MAPKLKSSLGCKDPETMQPHVRAEYERVFTRKICPAYNGARLKGGGAGEQGSGRNIAELSSMQVSDLAVLVRTIEAPQVGPLLATLAARLEKPRHNRLSQPLTGAASQSSHAQGCGGLPSR